MPTGTKNASFYEQAQAIAPELVRLRRTIHVNPELSFHETATASLVKQTLEKHGYKPRLVANGIGVLAEIGPAEGPVVALRADMDALPIQEANATEYCSKTAETMHACGHDAHTACLLGAAILLKEMEKRGELPGRIRLLFQPAEETINEEGKSGATLLIEEGALKDVKSAVAVHVFPSIPAGTIALRSGPFLAGCSSFRICIKGVGAHGAMPQLGVDAIVLSSHVVQAVQTIVSRRTSALEPVVVTIGGIKSATYRPNIVAEEVEIIGTARYFEPSMKDFVCEELRRCCQIAEAMGGSFELKYTEENPVLANAPEVTEKVRAAAIPMIGAEAIFDAPMEMGAEDFSFVSTAVPSCFVVLGAALPGEPRKFHTSTFDIDEAALPLGAAILAASAIELLRN